MAELVTVKETADLEKILKELPIELRVKALRSAARAGGAVVRRAAQKLAPVGDPSHNPDAKPLSKSIGMVVESYKQDTVAVAIVGPQRPAGAHGHLIEGGHDVVVSRGERKGQQPLSGKNKVPGKEFMAPAVDGTLSKQDAAIIKSLGKSLEQASSG